MSKNQILINSNAIINLKEKVIYLTNTNKELIKVLEDILDELEDTAYHTSMMCHIEKANDLLKNLKLGL